MSASVAVHAGGSMVIFTWLERVVPERLERMSKLHNLALLISLFLVILALHVIEITLWAFFYDYVDCFDDFKTSLYYSFTAYTTTGFGDVVLPRQWQLVGAIEGCVGILLFGWSTAFTWAFIHQFLTERHRRSRQGE
ncbi:ion channel [Kolteria novifilia]